jgi:hypothetical protein
MLYKQRRLVSRRALQEILGEKRDANIPVTGDADLLQRQIQILGYTRLPSFLHGSINRVGLQDVHLVERM